MIPVIGLAGRMGSGKSTAAEHLVAAHGYRQVDFADALRAAVATLDPIVCSVPMRRYTEVVAEYGYVEAKRMFPEVRRVLQVMGTDVVRALDPDMWVGVWVRETAQRAPIVAADVRFDNEIQAVLDAGGEVWWIDRPGCTDGTHPSEHAIRRSDCDTIIRNTGTVADLHRLIDAHLA